MFIVVFSADFPPFFRFRLSELITFLALISPQKSHIQLLILLILLDEVFDIVSELGVFLFGGEVRGLRKDFIKFLLGHRLFRFHAQLIVSLPHKLPLSS